MHPIFIFTHLLVALLAFLIGAKYWLAFKIIGGILLFIAAILTLLWYLALSSWNM
jgi:hypothetical protein